MRTVEELRRRKNSRQVIHLNVLLIGPRGIGKHSFLENLVKNSEQSKIIEELDNEGSENESSNTTSKHYSVNIHNDVSSPIAMDVTLCNIMDRLNNSSSPRKLREYIESQLNSYLMDEFKVSRENGYNDTLDRRLHVCLLFIDGSANGLHEVEIEILKEIYSLINVIVVVGKADRFTVGDMESLKSRVREDISEHNISTFDFGNDFMDDIFEESEHTLIKDHQPFSIILSKRETQNQNISNGEDKHSDVKSMGNNISNLEILKGLILGSHLQELKYSTNNFIYEKFRTRKLLERQYEKELLSASSDDRNNITSEEGEVSPISLPSDPKSILDVFSQKNIGVGKELEEKNKIIEAYQRKIGDLEKILECSNGPSPVTRNALCDMEHFI